ncbi:hypothetical protein, partial [Acinetobacter sp. ATCC 27244]|uniref:hypothetical protein n=1 Tax=Acinetobacter sp. (strain ATCC 27244 / 9458) TaxID=525244 RepID=UPI001CC1CBC0
VRTDHESKPDEIFGCKILFVRDYSYRFGFFEFDDLDKYRNYQFNENFRKYEDGFNIPKNLPSLYELKPWEASLPKQPEFDYVLRIPFSVLEIFKSANISKNEMEERKRNYGIRKGIYEPESRF